MKEEDKETRIRRLKYRANHRGIKEMDIILGSFADEVLDTLDETQVSDFEALMAEHDRDLLTWFTGELEFPFEDLNSIFELVRDHTLARHANA